MVAIQSLELLHPLVVAAVVHITSGLMVVLVAQAAVAVLAHRIQLLVPAEVQHLDKEMRALRRFGMLQTQAVVVVDLDLQVHKELLRLVVQVELAHPIRSAE